MKRIIRAQEEVFAMSKILDKYAIPSVKNDLTKFIYFSESNSSHGPRIKFYGGTKETSSAKDAPTLAFDIDGQCSLELADWMNKKNCPNAFDSNCLNKLHHFVETNLCILLLVWFRHLDEADALAYFHGQIGLNDLTSDIEPEINQEIFNLVELDDYCINNNLYSF